MTRDFTLLLYEELCQALLGAGYASITIAEYMAQYPQREQLVLLRHDVDRWPNHALRMAQLERSLGIRATYYIRMTRHAFQPEVVRQICALGHEIGYHYETYAKARGDRVEAIATFKQELSTLRNICKVETISMHGSPLSAYDNLDLWKHACWSDFGLLGEAYLSLDYSQVDYYTDTGRAWNSRSNLRDRVPDIKGSHTNDIATTQDLIAAVRERVFDHVCIQTHPERWASTRSEWLVSRGADFTANQVKLALKTVRSLT